MVELGIHSDIERAGPFENLHPAHLGPDRAMAAVTDIGLMRAGTGSGRPTVTFVIRMPDGTTVLAETTWALFKGAAIALPNSPIAREDARRHP